MKLIQPNRRLRGKFIEVIEDYKENEEWFYYYMYEEALRNYGGYLKRLEELSEGIDLPEGGVPMTLYWLVDDEEEEIRGLIRIRHRAIPVHGNIGYDIPPKMRFKGYGGELLRLGIEKAREMGMEKVRVTCAAGNAPSKRIIESNGGRYLESSMDNFERFNQYIIE